MTFFETHGIPTAAVATTEFLNAARAQARELGMPAYEVVVVQHPIQPLERDDLRKRADAAFDQIVSRLTANGH